MSKIKDAILCGDLSRPTVRRHPASSLEIERSMANLFTSPAEVVKNWYGEYIANRDKLSLEVDMTDDWYER